MRKASLAPIESNKHSPMKSIEPSFQDDSCFGDAGVTTKAPTTLKQ
jgi:hypothetical protein